MQGLGLIENRSRHRAAMLGQYTVALPISLERDWWDNCTFSVILEINKRKQKHQQRLRSKQVSSRLRDDGVE